MAKILKPGTFYIVPTPLGNLKDISPRALELLNQAPVWAAEDTRTARRLAAAIGRSKAVTYLRCDEHMQAKNVAPILKALKDGLDVLFTTDAGTPGVSDPGYRIIDILASTGVEIQAVPGPSAVSMALSLCHFSVTPYVFWGFAAKKQQQCKRDFESLLENMPAFVLFESPHRIVQTLKILASLAPNRQGLVCREMTKLHEEHFRGTLGQILAAVLAKNPKGEYTVCVQGKVKEKIKRVHTNKYKNVSSGEDE